MTPCVVIPARDAARYLPDLFAALRRQTVPCGEIVVADDRSTDDTARVARGLGARVAAVPPPGGPGVARNTGAAAAAGDPILFLDADTIPPDDWVERHLRRLDEEGPETLVVWGGYAGPVVDGDLPRLQHHDIGWNQGEMRTHVEVVTTANFSVRRAAFDRVGGIPAMEVNEDYVFGARIAEIGRIRWDAENRVRHRYKTAWPDYLRQQFAWARGMPEMYLRAPRLLVVPNSFRKDRILLELGLLVAALALPAAGAVGRLAAAGAAAGWVLSTGPFRNYLRARGESGLPVVRYLLARDLVWILGLAAGSAAVFIPSGRGGAGAESSPSTPR